MKKNKKLISLISAAAILTSALPMTGMAITSNIEKDIAKPIKTVFDESSYNYMINNISTLDTNHNNKIDIDDYIAIRNGINALYKNNDFNSNIAASVTDNTKKLNVDGNDKIDMNDYCCMLSYLQKDFSYYIYSPDDAAVITGYKNKNADKVTIPTEIYDNGKIYPVMWIEGNTFENMTSLTEVTIKDYTLPDWINKYNKNIGANTNGDKVKASNCVYIDDNAFSGCSSLTKINLPDHVSFSKNAFAGTGLENHFNKTTNEEICYFNSDNNKIVACGPKNDYISSNSITIKEGTTSICNNAFNGYSFNTVELPESLTYLGEGAFSNCKNLTKIIHKGKTIENVTRNDGSIVVRYLSAFNSTPVVVNSTETAINDIVSTIKDNIHYTGNAPLTAEQQKKAVNELGKYIYTTTYYRSFGHEGLFVTDRYNAEDQDRGSICSAGAAFLLDSTECEGFSFASSLVLDKLGIKNYSIGGHAHALNAVFIDNKWYTLDLSGEGEREFDPNYDCGNPTNDIPKTDSEIASEFANKLQKKNFLFEIVRGYFYGIAGRDQFDMFESSKEKQLNNAEIRFTSSSDDSSLILNCNIAQLFDPQYKVIRDDIQNGIISLNQAAPSDNNWIIDGDVMHCYDQNGIIKKNQWVKNEDDELCYVDANGEVTYDLIISDDVVYNNGTAAPTGINNVDGNLFYVNEDGSLAVNTWVNNGDDIYCTNGCGNVIKDQWAYTSYGKAYYMGSDGKPNSNYELVDGKVKTNGNLITSDLIYLSDGIYAADENGYLVKNSWFAPYGNEEYYFDSTGKCLDEYKIVNGKVYFQNSLFKSRTINDIFAVNENSEIAKNSFTKCGATKVFSDKNGIIQKHKWTGAASNFILYAYDDGHLEEDIRIIEGCVRKNNGHGRFEIVKGEFELDGIKYHTNNNGVLID